MSEATASQSRIKISWFIWTLLAFLLFAVVGAYSSHMTRTYNDYDQQRVAERYANLTKLRAEAQQTLTTADWVNQDKKIVRIPIQEAMVKELDTLKAQAPQVGGVIPGAVPAPTPATNAAPATPTEAPATNTAPATHAASVPAAITPPPAKPTP